MDPKELRRALQAMKPGDAVVYYTGHSLAQAAYGTSPEARQLGEVRAMVQKASDKGAVELFTRLAHETNGVRTFHYIARKRNVTRKS